MNKVILTDRDTALLHDCYKNLSLSISQIRERHFKGCGKATTLNRLSRLKTSGYLKSQRVGIVIYQGAPRKIGAVYQTTKTGLTYLKCRYPSKVFREEPLQLNTTTLPHDLLLTEVITRLKELHPGKEVIRGCLASGIESGERIPDAILFDESGKPEMAVELELTAKSNERYRDIILQYRLSKKFPNVLYVANDRNILDKIKCHIIQGKANPLLPEPSLGKFKLVLLHDLLKASEPKGSGINLTK